MWLRSRTLVSLLVLPGCLEEDEPLPPAPVGGGQGSEGESQDDGAQDGAQEDGADESSSDGDDGGSSTIPCDTMMAIIGDPTPIATTDPHAACEAGAPAGTIYAVDDDLCMCFGEPHGGDVECIGVPVGAPHGEEPTMYLGAFTYEDPAHPNRANADEPKWILVRVGLSFDTYNARCESDEGIDRFNGFRGDTESEGILLTGKDLCGDEGTIWWTSEDPLQIRIQPETGPACDVVFSEVP